MSGFNTAYFLQEYEKRKNNPKPMTQLEQRFYEYQLPEIIRQLKTNNELLKEQNELLKKVAATKENE